MRCSHTAADATKALVVVKDQPCHTPKEARTNLLQYLMQSDIQKRQQQIQIPFFTGGTYMRVIYADQSAPTGVNRFTGICIARRNKGYGSTFILRNVIQGISVERTFELYSPKIKEIQVLKLERRRRAKLYYLRDKPLKYSTVNENMEPIEGEMTVYRRRGRPA